jgi:hypothetical protein
LWVLIVALLVYVCLSIQSEKITPSNPPTVSQTTIINDFREMKNIRYQRNGIGWSLYATELLFPAEFKGQWGMFSMYGWKMDITWQPSVTALRVDRGYTNPSQIYPVKGSWTRLVLTGSIRRKNGLAVDEGQGWNRFGSRTVSPVRRGEANLASPICISSDTVTKL